MENSNRFDRPSHYESNSENKPLQLRKKGDMNFNEGKRSFSSNSYKNERTPQQGNYRNPSESKWNRNDSDSRTSYNSDRNRSWNNDAPRTFNNERRSNYGNSNRYGNAEAGGYNSERRSNYSGNRPSYNEGGNFNNERRSNYGGNRANNEGGGYNNERRSSYGNNNNRYANNEGGYNSGERRTSYGGGANRPNSFNNNSNNRFDKPRGNSFQQRNSEPYSGDSQKVNFRPRKNSGTPKERKSFSPYKEEVDLTKPVRLNRYLANAGICSRREADEYIQAGVISVNDVIVTELGTKVLPTDKIKFHEQTVRTERKIYLILNKPKDYVTTVEDTHDRKTVMDLVKNACSERIYPVGRLDRNTTGVLLFTNDGDLAVRLTHPKHEKKKIYEVLLDRDLTEEDFKKILNEGVELDDGVIKADDLAYVKDDNHSKIGIEIHSGKNRVVRRLFDKLGYKVRHLDRVYFAGLTKKNLPRGKFRFLNGKEISMLKMGAYT